jgi:hypothetical protein
VYGGLVLFPKKVMVVVECKDRAPATLQVLIDRKGRTRVQSIGPNDDK